MESVCLVPFAFTSPHLQLVGSAQQHSERPGSKETASALLGALNSLVFNGVNVLYLFLLSLTILYNSVQVREQH